MVRLALSSIDRHERGIEVSTTPTISAAAWKGDGGYSVGSVVSVHSHFAELLA
jgi:hypothetical protein